MNGGVFSGIRATENKILKAHLNFPLESPYCLVRGNLGSGKRNPELTESGAEVDNIPRWK